MEAFDGLKKIQDGCRYHGNRGTKIMGTWFVRLAPPTVLELQL